MVAHRVDGGLPHTRDNLTQSLLLTQRAIRENAIMRCRFKSAGQLPLGAASQPPWLI